LFFCAGQPGRCANITKTHVFLPDTKFFPTDTKMFPTDTKVFPTDTQFFPPTLNFVPPTLNLPPTFNLPQFWVPGIRLQPKRGGQILETAMHCSLEACRNPLLTRQGLTRGDEDQRKQPLKQSVAIGRNSLMAANMLVRIRRAMWRPL